MAAHSRILAWKIPQTEEPGGLQPIKSQRVRLKQLSMHAISSIFFQTSNSRKAKEKHSVPCVGMSSMNCLSIVCARKKIYRNNLKFYIYVCFIYMNVYTHTHIYKYMASLASLVPQLVKNPPAMQEMLVEFLGRNIPWRRDRLPTPVFIGLPSGSAGKESACNVGDLGSVPGLGRSLEGGLGNPL